MGDTIFVGRDRDLSDLDALLQGNNRVAIAAVGMGGVGKTTLARHYVMRHRSDYPGGVWWLSGQSIALEVLGCADRMGLRVELPMDWTEERIVQHYFDRWSDRFGDRKLLVIDDVTAYETVKAFLPKQGSFQVLMTTKVKFGKPVKRLDLGMLRPSAAFRLLRSHIDDDDKFKLAIPAAKDLCEWLGCLPLAIELVGRYLAQTGTIASVLVQLRAKALDSRAIGQVHGEMDYKHNVRAAIELSWEPLDEEARRVAMVLGVFGLGAIELGWVEACVEEEAVEEILDLDLVRRSLVERTEEGYRLHSLVREFLREKLAGTEDAKAVRLRCAIVMMDVVEQYREQGHYRKAIPLSEEALEIRKSELGDRHPDTVTSLNNLAMLYKSMGQYNKTLPLLEDVLKIRKLEFGNRHPNIAISLNNLAGLCLSMGRYDRALPLYKSALEIRKLEFGDRHPDTAKGLNNLAELHRLMGQYDLAFPLHESALEIRKLEFGNQHPYTAQSMNNLALLYSSIEQYNRALPLNEESLVIYQLTLGNQHPDTAMSMNNLALLYYLMGHYGKSLPLYESAISVAKKFLGFDHPNTKLFQGNLRLLREKMGIENVEVRRGDLGLTEMRSPRDSLVKGEPSQENAGKNGNVNTFTMEERSIFIHLPQTIVTDDYHGYGES